MIGAWEGKIELMRLFISRGADINKLNANGESAMALAAWRGHLEAVKWLLERGARINAAPRQWSALHYAVFAGHPEVANYLIEQGADINAQSTNGSSVLMMAVYEGHQDLARKLIEKGADRTPKNDWGDGALEWAMRQNRLEIAKMVSNPEEFNIAVSQPKEKWGEPMRSLRTSKELEEPAEHARKAGSSAACRPRPSTSALPPSACASCAASSTARRRPGCGAGNHRQPQQAAGAVGQYRL
jgi:hypothetical protein